MAFCSSCGGKIEENQKFCPNCGARKEASAIAAPAQAVRSTPPPPPPPSPRGQLGLPKPPPPPPESSSDIPPPKDTIIGNIDREDLEDSIEKGVEISKKGLGLAFNLAKKGFSRGVELAEKGIEVAKETIDDQMDKRENDQHAVQAPSMQPAQGSKFCPSCGQSVQGPGKFCNHCGYKLN